MGFSDGQFFNNFKHLIVFYEVLRQLSDWKESFFFGLRLVGELILKIRFKFKGFLFSEAVCIVQTVL